VGSILTDRDEYHRINRKVHPSRIHYFSEVIQVTTDTSVPPVCGGRAASGRIALCCAVGAVIAVGCLTAPASATTGDTSSGTTTANVVVNSAIALTGLTPSFTLTGLPGSTVATSPSVTFNVQTNNLGGYAVTVQSQTPTLTPAIVTNPDSIPIADLSVRETGTTTFTPLSNLTSVTVHTQSTRSAQGGDSLANDYEVAVPFVNQDTYHVVLNYIATAL
jgi:hypothetical protein